MLKYIIYIFLLLPLAGTAQTVTGKVVDRNNKALPGASVFWINGNKAVKAAEDGSFSINKKSGTDKLVASHAGYISDTLDVSNSENIVFVLNAKGNLDAVVVNADKPGTVISNLTPFK